MLMPEIADDERPRLARGVRFQIDGTTGKGVLLFPEGILELNETAQEILTRCNGRTLGEIDADPATLATDVRETLAELQRRNLVEFA
jgi:coenzyme PQQ biosynthesis protein PqqD